MKKGADVNAIYSESGHTCLSFACANNSLDIAKYLISKGAGVDGTGYLGFDYMISPLYEAIDKNNITMVELLLKNGAKTDTVFKEGEFLSALDCAKQMNESKIIELLERNINICLNKVNTHKNGRIFCQRIMNYKKQ